MYAAAASDARKTNHQLHRGLARRSHAPCTCTPGCSIRGCAFAATPACASARRCNRQCRRLHSTALRSNACERRRGGVSVASRWASATPAAGSSFGVCGAPQDGCVSCERASASALRQLPLRLATQARRHLRAHMQRISAAATDASSVANELRTRCAQRCAQRALPRTPPFCTPCRR